MGGQSIFRIMRLSTAVRLGLLTLLFLLSLLVVFPAPTTLAWKLAIIATEWGYVIAAMVVLLMSLPWRTGKAAQRVGIALGIVTVVLSLVPVAQAIPIGRSIDSRLMAAFGLSSVPEPTDAADVQRDTIAYVADSATGTTLGIDVYRHPRAGRRAPCILVIHGGSWARGTRRDLAPLNTYLARRGYVVAAMSYRFAPAHPFPAAQHDVNAAIATLKKHTEALGIDSTQFVLLGRSAGGQLALLAAYTAQDPAIRGVVGLYAPTDMRFGYDNPANPRVIDSRGTLRAYLGGTPSEVGDRYDAASPLRFVNTTTVPTLLIHGARDELVTVRHSDRLAAALAREGRPSVFLRIPWATHGCDYNLSGPCGRLTRRAVTRFVAAVTKHNRP